jgi:small-conductance mechanosensitive channel
LPSAAEHRPRLRSRTRDLAERRLSLVKLLVALFVARMVVTVVEVTEQRLSFWTILVTLAIGVEAWRAWSVARVARREHLESAPLPDSGWDRFLRPVERVGPAVVYGLTAVFAVAALVLLVLGNPRDALLDVAVVCREITTVVFVAVILAAYMSVREQPRPAR